MNVLIPCRILEERPLLQVENEQRDLVAHKLRKYIQRFGRDRDVSKAST